MALLQRRLLLHGAAARTHFTYILRPYMPRKWPTLHTFISSFLRAMPIVSGRNCGAPNLSVDLVGGLQLGSQSKSQNAWRWLRRHIVLFALSVWETSKRRPGVCFLASLDMCAARWTQRRPTCRRSDEGQVLACWARCPRRRPMSRGRLV